MADITKRVPDCEDDCEGERGKRGKRGHRGHRGHDGHDGHDGHRGHDGRDGHDGQDCVKVPFPSVSSVNDLRRASGTLFTANSVSTRPLGVRVLANTDLATAASIPVQSSIGPYAASGRLVVVTSAGMEIIPYTAKVASPPSFTITPGAGIGIVNAQTLISQAVTLAAPTVLPAATITADVPITGNFPVPAGATTVDAASNGEALPQSEIAIGNTAGFPTSGYARVVSSTGIQLVSYTGLTPGAPGAITGCQGGTGVLTTGNAVTAVGQLWLNSDLGQQLVTYSGISGANFTGVLGGAGTVPAGPTVAGMATPTAQSTDFVSGTWAVDFGIAAGQISTPAEIAAIKWDAAVNVVPTLPVGFPIAPFSHCHSFENLVVSGFTRIPNTAIAPIVDNSQLILTGTVQVNCGVTGLTEPLPYTFVVTRVSACCGISLQLDNYFHQSSRMTGVANCLS